MAGEALRVLGMAYKLVPGDKKELNSEDLEGLTFLGLQGMIDPPRDEAIEAVQKCKHAGIRVVMITGDHAETAKAIAQQLGIGGNVDRVLTGEDLSRMSDAELYEVVPTVSVYARASPEHKFRITTQLRRRGEIIAVTGDGVNDAPALAASDVGIALGCGTDLARESAPVALLADDLGHVPWSIELARRSVRVMRQNLFWAFAYNAAGIGLAATGWLNPAWAAAAMVVSSLLVVGNSLRLASEAPNANIGERPAASLPRERVAPEVTHELSSAGAP